MSRPVFFFKRPCSNPCAADGKPCTGQIAFGPADTSSRCHYCGQVEGRGAPLPDLDFTGLDLSTIRMTGTPVSNKVNLWCEDHAWWLRDQLIDVERMLRIIHQHAYEEHGPPPATDADRQAFRDRGRAMTFRCQSGRGSASGQCSGTARIGPDETQGACSECGAQHGRDTNLAHSSQSGGAAPAESAAPPQEDPKHAAEHPGSDGLGYGRCTACGEMWPCTTVRARAGAEGFQQ